mgnify:CR=1 FL=1
MKKRIAAALIGGGVLAGGFSVVDKLAECDYEVEYLGEVVCVDQEIKELLEAKLPLAAKFGGVKFNQQ